MKIFKFEISFEIIEIIKNPIRKSLELDKLLVKTIQSILNGTSIVVTEDHEEFNMCIYIDKMSRVFYFQKNKIFSMCFPFYIKKEEQKNVDYLLYEELFIIKDNDINIDSNIINILASIYNDISVLEKGFEESYFELEEKLQALYYDFNLPETVYPIDDIWMLITTISTNEPGYLRYDYDNKNNDKDMHPLNHIDFYCTDKNTFKIGLHEDIDLLDMIEILDNNKERFYLKKD